MRSKLVFTILISPLFNLATHSLDHREPIRIHTYIYIDTRTHTYRHIQNKRPKEKGHAQAHK